MFINAKQANGIHLYKNTKRKLYRTIAAIWYNKACMDKQLTTNHININSNKKQQFQLIRDTSRQQPG